MILFDSVYRGRKVFVTGHTGFKGAWLSQWLISLGADVTGYSLAPNTTPSLFTQLGLENRLNHNIGDIQDLAHLREVMAAANPDFIFHLAAQPLVRDSYNNPLYTWNVNVGGTANVLEILRELKAHCVAVFITTDKCYENREWHYGYREEDALGGHDPYSASKAAAELAIASYRRSFFKDQTVKAASVRAGNVIGGGDWAKDRIVPDCIRALQCDQPILVRNKRSVRPWQHVLEPLSGYLWLGARLAQDATADSPLVSAFNFGPGTDANRTVLELTTEIVKHWPGTWEDRSDPTAVHEAHLLRLTTDKANALLGWQPVWPFSEAVRQTVTWYKAAFEGQSSPSELTLEQIQSYTKAASARELPWVKL